MSLFWTYENDLPNGVGFNLYGWQHVLWMMILAAGIFVILRKYRKFCNDADAGNESDKVQAGSPAADNKISRSARAVRLSAAAAALFLQIAQAVYRIILGVYDVGTLPLHICSIASYAVFIHCLLKKPPKWFSEILFFPLLPGAMCAVLFPDWTRYPAFSFMSCAGFLVHGAIILYILLQITDGTIRPSIKRAWSPWAFLAVYALIMIPFDNHYKVNYGFLAVPSPGSPLIFIANVFPGYPGYLFGFGLLVFFVMLLCYGLARLCLILFPKIHTKATAS